MKTIMKTIMKDVVKIIVISVIVSLTWMVVSLFKGYTPDEFANSLDFILIGVVSFYLLDELYESIRDKLKTKLNKVD